jgi:hypothetical protein
VELFRKDQFWFTQKTAGGQTTLTALDQYIQRTTAWIIEPLLEGVVD